MGAGVLRTGLAVDRAGVPSASRQSRSGITASFQRSRSPSPYGFGRLDAFGILTNEVVGTALGMPENVRVPNAPVSYPFLWNTPQLEWVQWNGTVHIPLLRNIGEVLGVFAQLTLTGAPADRFKSSADVHNLFLLEMQLESLEPPRWPEHILGAVDRERAARGKALFESEAAGCSACHSAAPPYPLTSDNEYGRRFIPITMVPFTALGTDSQAILDFSIRTANTGPLTEVAGTDVALTGPLSKVVFQEVMKRQFAELGLSELEQLEHSGFRDDREQARVLSYKAGPLAGIWATAPYLHNGSVPNLYELLLPTEQRSKMFHVGSREFDPAHVGLDTSQGEHTSLLDTSVRGNSNAGHTFGSALSDDQRWDLVEYLKTL
ncbi:MAG: di-heme-cytochrome C peroxidase [Acidobacteria bacterium]|nr:di-heme-cytochrome C peroxidase [Acidobacteriota bacterium]